MIFFSNFWIFLKLDAKVVDYPCEEIMTWLSSYLYIRFADLESHAWKEWRMKPHTSALGVSLAWCEKKIPWVLVSPSPSVPYHQTALRSMWAPLRNSETWSPTSCRLADAQRFSPWSLGDFTVFVNGLIHFVLMHVPKRFRSFWTGKIGICPFWNVIGTKKAFSWLVGLKGGVPVLFCLSWCRTFSRNARRKWNCEILRAFQKQVVFFLKQRIPDIFPSAPILHVLAAPPSGKVCRLQTRHPRLREYIASAGLEVPGTEGGVELLADDDWEIGEWWKLGCNLMVKPPKVKGWWKFWWKNYILVIFPSGLTWQKVVCFQGRTDDGDLAERAATHVPSLSAGDSYPQYIRKGLYIM